MHAHTIATILLAMTATSALAFIVLHVAFWSATRALRAPNAPHGPTRSNGQATRGVSILKPCAGAEDGLAECLASFCALEHAPLEILCGVRDLDDPAVRVICEVQVRFPNAPLALIVTASGRSVNPKVAQLEVLERAARYDVLWISDSNTAVHPETLGDMLAKLATPGVGLVLQPVAGVGERTLGAAVENLHVAAFITVSTIGLRRLTGRVFAPGKSALFRRDTLARLGGFETLGRYCAEDHMLVERVRALGLSTLLAERAVANVNRAAPLRRFADRHLRWTQLHWRVTAPGTMLELLLYPALFGVLAFLAHPTRITGLVALAALAIQFVADLAALRRVRGESLGLRHVIALPIRVAIFPVLWARAAFRSKVVWRGNVRWLGRDTLLLDESMLRTRVRAVLRAAFA